MGVFDKYWKSNRLKGFWKKKTLETKKDNNEPDRNNPPAAINIKKEDNSKSKEKEGDV